MLAALTYYIVLRIKRSFSNDVDCIGYPFLSQFGPLGVELSICSSEIAGGGRGSAWWGRGDFSLAFLLVLLPLFFGCFSLPGSLCFQQHVCRP